MRHLLIPLTAFALACGGSGGGATDICGVLSCPAGTTPVASASEASGTAIEGSLDPTSWSGGLAYRQFGEGECSLTCETIQACPEGSWPVISASCFTCASLDSEGNVVQAACGTTNVQTGDIVGAVDCDSDAWCGGGYACDTFRDVCNEQCDFDSDCKADFICDSRGACVLPECLDDEDCLGGAACSSFHLECTDRCSSPSECKGGYTCDDAGQCIVAECSSDSDCGGGYCFSGMCDSTGCAVVDASRASLVLVGLGLGLVGLRRRVGFH